MAVAATATRKGLARAYYSRRHGLLAIACILVAGCDQSHQSEGEKLARANCSACHAFPEPQLLDKKTWQEGVLPQMAQRLGVPATSLAGEMSRDPNVKVLAKPVSQEDWAKIVGYFRDNAPDSLPYQTLPAQPQRDPDFFTTGPFVPHMQSSGIVTLLKADSVHKRIFVGEGGDNTLRIFDWNRRLLSTLKLGSAPTGLIVEGDSVLVLESGILDPNDQPRGSLVKYAFAGADSLRSPRVVIDSLFRPVFVEQFDFDRDGVNEFIVCEFGNNRGRLALYKNKGSRYERQILDASPGAIRFEIRDMTGDGAPDIVVLFAQGDERIVLFENDGKGNFTGRQRILARFPPVYGSMDFSMHDFNGDGKPDILYVNGDNFDYSRVLKPYHGIRILENDGNNNFNERYFFPMYGAAGAEVADFDKDGDLDILAVSNFADAARHPERGIVYLENSGKREAGAGTREAGSGKRDVLTASSDWFRPYAFSVASSNAWNLTALADLNGDGWLDVIVGAMDLRSVGRVQKRYSGASVQSAGDPILLFENRMKGKAADNAH